MTPIALDAAAGAGPSNALPTGPQTARGSKALSAWSAADPATRGLRVLAAIVIPPHLSVSGGARAAEALSAELTGLCDVTVASMLNRGGAPAPSGACVKRRDVAVTVPPPLRLPGMAARHRSLFYRSDIDRLLSREPFDLLHLHNPLPGLELQRLAEAARAHGISYAISTHGYNEVANGTEIYRFGPLRRAVWERCMVRPVARATAGASAIFTLSPADEPIVRAMGFAGPVVEVPNGVALPPPSDPSDAERLERLGIAAPLAGDGIRLAFVGNHTPNKGLPDLLAAVRQLTIPYRLVVVGERRDQVDYTAGDTGRADQSVIVTGRLPDEDVAAILRDTDLFVFPTLADTFPLVVLEAMSHGVAVLASRVGGIPHQIAGGCGELTEPGDPAALVAAITRLAADRQALAAMGARGRERVAQKYTWRRAAEAALAGYRKILAA